MIDAFPLFSETFFSNNPQEPALQQTLWYNPLIRLNHVRKLDISLIIATNKSYIMTKKEFYKDKSWIPTSRMSWSTDVNIPLNDDFWPRAYKLPFSTGSVV